MSHSAGASLLRRATYDVVPGQDRFIVSLLRNHIERALTTYAAPASPEARVLDVGCGRQPFRVMLESIGYTYTSLDLHQNPEGRVDIIAAIDEPLPVELINRGPFQFILCTEVMEHVANWEAAFNNLASLLAHGGRLLITCPFVYPLHEEPYDFWRPTVHTLKRFADRVGLEMLELETAGDAWDVLGTILLANYQGASGGRRLLDRVVAQLVALGERGLFRLLSNRRMRQVIPLRSQVYLANVAILQRP